MYIIFYNVYPMGHEIIISNKNQVMPFLGNISLSKIFDRLVMVYIMQ